MSNDRMTTQPTLYTFLSRLDEWGARITNELSDIRAAQDELRAGQGGLRQSMGELRTGQGGLLQSMEELRKGQDELRSDLKAGLRRVERKIEIFNDNILTIKRGHTRSGSASGETRIRVSG